MQIIYLSEKDARKDGRRMRRAVTSSTSIRIKIIQERKQHVDLLAPKTLAYLFKSILFQIVIQQLNGAALLSVNDRTEHTFIGQWLILNDQSAYRWYTSGIIYDLQNNDLRWEGDGTPISMDNTFWLNQAELNKPGEHIVYTYGVFDYLWSRTVASSKLPYICEIRVEEAYRVIQQERDYAISYAWYKGTSHFVRPDLNPHLFISRNGKLYFSEVSHADQGDYRCLTKLISYNGAAIGTNQPPSRTSLPIELVVQNAVASEWGPEISNDFVAVFPSTPMIGQTIYLECLAFGLIPITYHWERIGLPMPPKASLSDHNRVLTIPNVELEDTGMYVCHARRKNVAFTYKNFTLSIEGKPFFSYPLKNQHVDIGGQLTWRCEATARPQATYEWYKNGIKLETIQGQLTVLRNTLTIQNLDPAKDNGMYQCAAQNIHGKVFSDAELRVLGFKPTFQKNPMQEKTYGGIQGTVTIICDPEAAPTPTYQWFKNNVNLGLSPGDTTSRIRMLQNGNLLINDINTGDAGTYMCRVENQFGADGASSILVITSKTTINIRPLNTIVRINNTAFMSCQASVGQYQELIYSWTFNGVDINTEQNYHYIQGVSQTLPGLYIRHADSSHTGYYECFAKTTQDMASARAYLTVEGPPGEPGGVFSTPGSITMSSLRLAWSVGQDNGRAILYYIVEGKPAISNDWAVLIQYVADSAGIVPGEDQTKRYVLVEGLNPGTGYHFRVRAANSFGIGPPSLVSEIYQTQPAPPLKSPDDVGGGGGSVGDLTITWTVSLSGRMDKYVTQVGVAYYYSLYEVMVHAFNNLGNGPNSTVSTIFSAEDMPVGVVQNVHSRRYNGTAIMVTWDAVDNVREVMKGTLMGYQVNYWERNDTDPILNSISWRVELPYGLIIGLIPDTWYAFTVQAFNTAGLNPLSEAAFQRTFMRPPRHYPTEVHVGSHGSQSVYITWRGVSTGAEEEPLEGYKIWHWPLGDDIRSAKELSVGKVDNAVIYGIQKNNLYMVRILAYSRGGDGTPSKTRYFTLGMYCLHSL
ncbi:hypothetical protein FSP39_015497 [Pinctada imbricata]|uniref:Contactin n=1 Tax=Pinctada imbricata TaxID=66713 RepID=A0AA89CCS2_PINIB|nr:hypothetical protein FSP39_015497 [Pinctada imbricata]